MKRKPIVRSLLLFPFIRRLVEQVVQLLPGIARPALLPVAHVEQFVELGLARRAAFLGHTGRVLEHALELLLRLSRATRPRGSERLARVEEELAEVPTRLVLDDLGLGLGARVVHARVVVAAVDAAAQVAFARFALGIARERLVDLDGRAAVVAVKGGHWRKRGGARPASQAPVFTLCIGMH